ncbi:MAG TPA: OB-fold domain-containing protein [Steroidobacteraceae bacterium]|nr:OB-fold domain-containing protein [Steroidobacteraceae bacterium]
MTMTRPVPRLTEENRFFWTSGADGRLRFMRCNDCGTTLHPPYPVCRRCLSENVAPHAVPGTGEIYSFTVNHQKWDPALEVPFVIARVAIDEAPGVLLTSNIVGCPVDSVDIGDRVRVRFERQGDIYYPLFEKL